ncbi:MAG TPA: hypothetical protein GXX39_05555 [Syntrophothermus lipocalidus]|nr:hypothetical protein [Syntrophothermus lipocalidus]
MHEYSVVKNARRYFERLNSLLHNNNIIVEPKNCSSLLLIHVDGQRRILGWKIEREQVKFDDTSYLDCDEYAIKASQFYWITSFSYHFQPSREEILFYRIDLKDGQLHINPDPRCGLSQHLTGEGTLDVKDFNLYLALLVALQYVGSYDKYPVDQGNREMYNRVIETGRRRLGSD